MKYPMLGKMFCEWYEEEYNDVWDEWNGCSIKKEMLAEMNLTYNEYFDKYIRPYLDLTEEQLNITLNILSNRLKDKLTPQPSPFCLSFKLTISPKINALEWLLVHVADLKYFEFNDFVKSKYEKPYNQCITCGMPDFYEKLIPYSRNKEKVEFSSKKKYCHMYECAEDNPNPSEHAEGCHYKEWAYIKKSMNQKLSRCIKRLNKLKEKNPIDIFETENIKEKIKQIEEEFCKIFEDFYKEQYKKNIKIQYTIRSKDSEIFNLKEFWS